VDAFLPLVRQYTDLQKLNAHILTELIEKIVTHEKERDENDNTAQQVDIYDDECSLHPTDESDEAKIMAIIA